MSITPSWLRRVVPVGYSTATLVLEGTSPLLMNSGETDRDSELYRSFYLLGQKRGKSLDDEARLREMEWKLALYMDKDLGPYVPARNVKELIRESATKWRKGEEIKRSLVVIDERIPVLYDGPRDEQGLWDGGYRLSMMVANAGPNRGRVVRCRPKFEDWRVEAALAFDAEDLDPDFLGLVVERCQKFGLGDGRSIGFGSFAAQLTDGFTQHGAGPVTASAVVEKNGDHSKAHRASVDRVVRETSKG